MGKMVSLLIPVKVMTMDDTVTNHTVQSDICSAAAGRAHEPMAVLLFASSEDYIALPQIPNACAMKLFMRAIIHLSPDGTL